MGVRGQRSGTHLRLVSPLPPPMPPTPTPPSGLMMLGTEFLQVRGLPLVKCTGLARTYAGNSCTAREGESGGEAEQVVPD